MLYGVYSICLLIDRDGLLVIDIDNWLVIYKVIEIIYYL